MFSIQTLIKVVLFTVSVKYSDRNEELLCRKYGYNDVREKIRNNSIIWNVLMRKRL